MSRKRYFFNISLRIVLKSGVTSELTNKKGSFGKLGVPACWAGEWTMSGLYPHSFFRVTVHGIV